MLILRCPMGSYRGTGEIVAFCTCGSLVAKWTYAFGACLALWCLPSYFLHPKLRKFDAVPITLKLITLTLQRSVSAPMAGGWWVRSGAWQKERSLAGVLSAANKQM